MDMSAQVKNACSNPLAIRSGFDRLVKVFEMKIMCVPSRILPSKKGDALFPSLFLPSQGLEHTEWL